MDIVKGSKDNTLLFGVLGMVAIVAIVGMITIISIPRTTTLPSETASGQAWWYWDSDFGNVCCPGDIEPNATLCAKQKIRYNCEIIGCEWLPSCDLAKEGRQTLE